MPRIRYSQPLGADQRMKPGTRIELGDDPPVLDDTKTKRIGTVISAEANDDGVSVTIVADIEDEHMDLVAVDYEAVSPSGGFRERGDFSFYEPPRPKGVDDPPETPAFRVLNLQANLVRKFTHHLAEAERAAAAAVERAELDVSASRADKVEADAKADKIAEQHGRDHIGIPVMPMMPMMPDASVAAAMMEQARIHSGLAATVARVLGIDIAHPQA